MRGSVAPGSHSPPRIRVRVHFDQVRVPANLIGQPGRHGKRTVTGAFSWTAALIGAACVGTMRAAFEYALALARSETRLGTVPVIEHQNVGFMLADIKMRIEACRYLTWKACRSQELKIYKAPNGPWCFIPANEFCADSTQRRRRREHRSRAARGWAGRGRGNLPAGRRAA